jgi:alpha-tubulin suppressor-like RCC1 family protein
MLVTGLASVLGLPGLLALPEPLGRPSPQASSVLPARLSSGLGASRAGSPPPVRLVAAGAYSAYALTAGGRVWAWGDGIEGQLGDGSAYTTSELPVRVGRLLGVSELAASNNTAYALRNGQVWSWGDGSQGQDGNGRTTYFQDRPEPVAHLAEAVGIAAGGYAVYALAAGGEVWAWGDNSSGQIGRHLSVPGSDLPVLVDLHRAGRLDALAAGTATAYALARDGTVWAWGDNAFGELGRPTQLIASTVPLRVPGLRQVVALAANGFTALALGRNGTVWAWGDGSFGELGAARCAARPGGGPGAGKRERASREHAGLRAAPGQPTEGPMSQCPPWPQPRRVVGLAGIRAIAAGGEAAYALSRDGTVWAWGNNAYGQLGDGTTKSSSLPVRVAGLSHVVALAAGGTSAYALETNGSLWAWGANAYGQLGDGTTAASDLPVRVRL